MKPLTIAMATYREYDALWFTITNILTYHPEIKDLIDFVVVDNDPKHPDGVAIETFMKSKGKYIPFTHYKGTAGTRDAAVAAAETPWVLMIDPHISFLPGTLKKLIDKLDSLNPNDLHHGLLVNEHGNPIASHMEPVWRQYMYGIWALDQTEDTVIEIPMHGMGIYLVGKDNWLGYNERFRGFGGEEGYIHQKYRNAGQHIWCLKDIQWLHRFRTTRTPYPNILEERFLNYLIGFYEVGLPIKPLIDQFSPHLKPGTLFRLIEQSEVPAEAV